MEFAASSKKSLYQHESVYMDFPRILVLSKIKRLSGFVATFLYLWSVSGAKLIMWKIIHRERGRVRRSQKVDWSLSKPSAGEGHTDDTEVI